VREEERMKGKILMDKEEMERVREKGGFGLKKISSPK
jgi:hypothetical protein